MTLLAAFLGAVVGAAACVALIAYVAFRKLTD